MLDDLNHENGCNGTFGGHEYYGCTVTDVKTMKSTLKLESSAVYLFVK